MFPEDSVQYMGVMRRVSLYCIYNVFVLVLIKFQFCETCLCLSFFLSYACADLDFILHCNSRVYTEIDEVSDLIYEVIADPNT